MKRKVSQIGPSTLMVSLPSRWVKKYGVKKGDELSLEEKYKGLTINTDKSPSSNSIEITINNLNNKSLWFLGKSLYEQGFDKIRFNFNKRNIKNINLIGPQAKWREIPVMETLSKLSNHLVGMEIIEHGSDYCIISEISKVKGLEFYNLLKNITKNIEEKLDKMLINLEKGKMDFNNIRGKFRGTKKFISCCKRIVNKENMEEVEKIAFNKILDIYSEISIQFPILYHNIEGIKLNKKILLNIKEINQIIKDFNKIVYGKNIQHLNDLMEKSINFEIKLLNEKIKDPLDAKIIENIRIINLHLREYVKDLGIFCIYKNNIKSPQKT